MNINRIKPINGEPVTLKILITYIAGMLFCLSLSSCIVLTENGAPSMEPAAQVTATAEAEPPKQVTPKTAVTTPVSTPAPEITTVEPGPAPIDDVLHIEYEDETLHESKLYTFRHDERENTERVVIWADKPLVDFSYIEIEHRETEGGHTVSAGRELFGLNELPPGKLIGIEMPVPETIPAYGVAFADANGAKRYYYITDKLVFAAFENDWGSGEFKTLGAGKSPYHPIVCGGLLLGGSVEGKWISPSDFAGSLTGNETYDMYNMDGMFARTIGSTVAPNDYNWGGPYAEFVHMLAGLDENGYIAINSTWDPMPRKPHAIPPDNETYINIVAELLREEGLEDAEIDILQIYRIDLDGDEQDEVVIYAENKQTPGGPQPEWETWRYDESKGCFSILILRKIVGGKVINFVLQCDVHTVEINEDYWLGYSDRRIRYIFGIEGFADLNGDGKMELVANWGYYEGYGYIVYEISDNSVNEVLSNGWGA